MVASAVVVESGVKLTCVTSELTRGQMDFGKEQPLFPVLQQLVELPSAAKTSAGEITTMLGKLTEHWWNAFGWIGLADPLTVAVALDPAEWGTYCQGRFQVHLDQGGVDFTPSDRGHHYALEAHTFQANGHSA